MAKAPIDMMLDGVQWVAADPQRPETLDTDMPYATHSGVLEICGRKLRVYRLSNGQAVIHADDINDFFEDANLVE